MTTRSERILFLSLAGLLFGCGSVRPVSISPPAPVARVLPLVPADPDPQAEGLRDLPDELFETVKEILPGARIVEIASQFVGVPYRKGGASPTGFDCSGLVYFTYRAAGITIPRTSASQHRAAQAVSLDALRSGDLLFFQIKSQRISHVGIFVADDLFLHAASSGKSVSYSRLGEAYWKKRLVGAGRFLPQDVD